jgi:primosomal protein N' (replication factor Y)
LIHGITGSGKTEVYLRALDDCIRLGLRAIFLVPEIALTPQTMERINMRFPNQVALIHSGMSIKNQLDQWWAIRRGEFNVVVGPRSALFSPMPKLGLVIIDEEHEWTYKEQERQPRYHVREVAVELARMVNICVVMGSATPDIVTYFEALKGKHKLFNLPYRVGVRSNSNITAPSILSLPKVDIADMRQELMAGNRSIFSRALSTGLKKCISKGEQAILFLNRRGSASVVQCRDCGMVLRCKRCAVTLTYHRLRGLLCHQCNLGYKSVTVCPECESPRIKYLGQGTQKVEEEIKSLLPWVSVSRWDSDSVVEAGGHAAIMESFARGESQILVGTQVVSKGLHLPNVSLVGVILADIGLHLPDFRAGERTFQLLCQVSGRAGRGDIPGNVIIQTYNPKNYAVLAGANQDYRAIFETEIEYRRQQGNPPFSGLAHLTYSHFNEDVCKEEAQNFNKELRKLIEGDANRRISVIGPAPAHVYRIRGKYRWHIILRGDDIVNLIERMKIPRGWSIDVDPVSVL